MGSLCALQACTGSAQPDPYTGQAHIQQGHALEGHHARLRLPCSVSSKFGEAVSVQACLTACLEGVAGSSRLSGGVSVRTLQQELAAGLPSQASTSAFTPVAMTAETAARQHPFIHNVPQAGLVVGADTQGWTQHAAGAFILVALFHGAHF